MAAFFSGLFPCGTQTVAGIPRICPAQASAAPWLPREAATTPRRFCSSDRALRAARAFRALNAWVGW